MSERVATIIGVVIALALLVLFGGGMYETAKADRIAAETTYVLAKAAAGAVTAQTWLLVAGAVGGVAMVVFIAWSKIQEARRHAEMMTIARVLVSQNQMALGTPRYLPAQLVERKKEETTNGLQ